MEPLDRLAISFENKKKVKRFLDIIDWSDKFNKDNKIIKAWSPGDLECESDWPQFNKIIDEQVKRRAEADKTIKKIKKFFKSLISDRV